MSRTEDLRSVQNTPFSERILGGRVSEFICNALRAASINYIEYEKLIQLKPL